MGAVCVAETMATAVGRPFLLARQLVRWQLQLVQLSLEAQQILMLTSAMVCGVNARADHHGQTLGGDELMRGFHLWLCIQHDPHAAFTFDTVPRS